MMKNHNIFRIWDARKIIYTFFDLGIEVSKKMYYNIKGKS